MIHVEPVGTAAIRQRADRQLPNKCCSCRLLPAFIGWCSHEGGRCRRASTAGKKRVNCTEEGVHQWWGIRWLGVSPHFHTWQNATNADNWKWKRQGTSSWQWCECEIWITSPGLVCVNAILDIVCCVEGKKKKKVKKKSYRKKGINDFHVFWTVPAPTCCILIVVINVICLIFFFYTELYYFEEELYVIFCCWHFVYGPHSCHGAVAPSFLKEGWEHPHAIPAGENFEKKYIYRFCNGSISISYYMGPKSKLALFSASPSSI